MKHVMIDLETMGLRPDAAIVSIGACHFDRNRVIDEFYTPISLDSCLRAGLTTDKSTVDWWFGQPVETRMAWQTEDAPTLEEALTRFSGWLRSLGGDVAPWGNGAGFDPVLLESAYRALKADAPWKFYNVMCFRTMKNLYWDVSPPARAGKHHHALDDAVYQTAHLHKILQIKGVELKD